MGGCWGVFAKKSQNNARKIHRNAPTNDLSPINRAGSIYFVTITSKNTEETKTNVELFEYFDVNSQLHPCTL